MEVAFAGIQVYGMLPVDGIRLMAALIVEERVYGNLVPLNPDFYGNVLRDIACLWKCSC